MSSQRVLSLCAAFRRLLASLSRLQKRCDSSDCCNYYDRDVNAALNILAAYLALAAGQARPAHLSRTNVQVHAQRGWYVLRHG